MKKLIYKGVKSSLIIGLFFFSFTSCDNAVSNSSDSPALSGNQTIKGEVLDMSCYLGGGAKGDSHKKCAQGCLDGGLPAGILAENGQVFLLIEDHNLSDVYNTAIQHAAETIEINGDVVSEGGVQALIVKEVRI